MGGTICSELSNNQLSYQQQGCAVRANDNTCNEAWWRLPKLLSTCCFFPRLELGITSLFSAILSFFILGTV